MLQALQEEVREEFGLTNNQMRSDVNGLPFAKNQWWFLDEVEIGYGDLRRLCPLHYHKGSNGP